MQRYELLYILPQSVADTEARPLVEKISAKIRDVGATIVREEHMGRRRLAYEIKKSQSGIYERVEFDAEPTAAKTLEQALRLMVEMLRFLIVKIPTKTLEELERERALQEKLARQFETALRSPSSAHPPAGGPAPAAPTPTPTTPKISEEELGKKIEELLEKPEI